MYDVYCQNKHRSEFIVSEYIDTYFEVWYNCLRNLPSTGVDTDLLFLFRTFGRSCLKPKGIENNCPIC